jgi:6-phosphogluconolactonase
MTNKSPQREIVVCHDAKALAEEAAERIIAEAQSAISVRGRFTLVLSGGSTPQRTYQLLAQPERRSKIDWSKTWLFFGDERCVPFDDPRSNFRMAAEALLKPLRIAADHVLAVPVEGGSPAQCAAEYERRLRKFFGAPAGDGFPHFDSILLGLGDDGHTASLFPGKPALGETEAWVAWSPPSVLPPPVDRVTLTFPVLNAAREVMFLVAGEKKAPVVREILEDRSDDHVHPAVGVKPTDGNLTWLLDEAAAKLLRQKRGANPAATRGP